MGKIGKVEKRPDVFYLVLVLSGLLILNSVFHVFSGLVFLLIIFASSVSLYLHLLQARYRKKGLGLFFACLSAVYNPVVLTALIVISDYRSVTWLLLFLVNMLRNPYLGFLPSVLNGTVSVLCFDFLAVKIYNLNLFEIVFGSLVFFIAAVLAWVLTLKLWLFEQQSMQDWLTGLGNRRSLNATLRQEIKRCLQNGLPISLLMVDVDNFKMYNDTLGHIRGDEILKKIAGIMNGSIRDSDLIFRYGGEEFCVLLPGVPLNRAQKVAERIREQVEWAFRGQKVPITVSIGVSSSEGDARNARFLLELADEAMYQAKAIKNKVVTM
ncbi:MAG: GGDEF domain-containing protein [Peptococcaceae bacterium]|nr:GGDEF domain-containing protein [Peptococcaceae bacterium]